MLKLVYGRVQFFHVELQQDGFSLEFESRWENHSKFLWLLTSPGHIDCQAQEFRPSIIEWVCFLQILVVIIDVLMRAKYHKIIYVTFCFTNLDN